MSTALLTVLLLALGRGLEFRLQVGRRGRMRSLSLNIME
jgi:hypothetical protein